MEYNIASVLKQLRKTSNYSANEVIEQLKGYEIEISAKTLYGYESGLSMPNANVFVALCKIYKCENPLDLFNNSSISPIEFSILEKYRNLDDHGKKIVEFMLDNELERCSDINENDVKKYYDAQRRYAEARKKAQKKSSRLISSSFPKDDVPPKSLSELADDLLNAAHALETATDEDKYFDEIIMDDENF